MKSKKKYKILDYDKIFASKNSNFEKLYLSAQNQTFLMQYCIKNLAESYKELEQEIIDLRKTNKNTKNT